MSIFKPLVFDELSAAANIDKQISKPIGDEDLVASEKRHVAPARSPSLELKAYRRQ